MKSWNLPDLRKTFFTSMVIIVILVDLIFGWYVLLFIQSTTPPKEYSIIPSVGFALPKTADGHYDVAVELNLTTPFVAGYEFLQGEPITVSVNATVWNPEFNATGNQLYLTFQSAEYWRPSPLTGRVGCETVLRPPYGVNLTKFVNPKAIVNGQITNLVEWHGTDTLCFLNQGSFEAIFTVVEPDKAPLVLQQNAGNISATYSIPIAEPSTYVNFVFSKASVFIGLAALLFAIVGSGSLMLELWDRRVNRVEQVNTNPNPSRGR